MTRAKADAILHPIRLRIILAVVGRQLTTQQIAETLPDVPQASLYRHIRRLVGAGALTIVEERPVRGVTEKVYQVAEKLDALDDAELAQIGPEDHLRYFTAFAMSLVAQFRLYLESGPTDLRTDGVSYRTAPIYADDEEFAQLLQALRHAMEPFLAQTPAPERRRRLLSAIILPDRRDPAGE